MAEAPPRSPLAPTATPRARPVAGVRLAAGATGTRYRGRDDVALLAFPEGTTVAGMLTRSHTPGHPVVWCRERLAAGTARGLVVNAGNANVFNGEAGDAAVRRTAEAAAEALGCGPSEVLIASTGVIGQPLDPGPIAALLPGLAAGLAEDGWSAAADAIRTTDTFPKLATRRATIDDVPVTLTGIAKGSGMVGPDMATVGGTPAEGTVLAFVATDACLSPAALRAVLAPAADASFHAITVDGDTSTSDTLLLFATGRARLARVERADDPHLAPIREALTDLLADLAVQVVRDGEGAKKLVTIDVTGAESDAAARRIGLTVANSPLVKTAIAGADANWGRVVMAIGRAGERIEPGSVRIAFGGMDVARNGAAVPDLDETPVAAHLGGDAVTIAVDVGVGNGRARVWTCDLTHGYVDINADYRS